MDIGGHAAYGGIAVQAETQFLQPQHEPVAQISQTRLGSAQSLLRHDGAHVWDWNRQIWSTGQGSSSSHRPGSIETQAPLQSAHFGQLEVAQPSQRLPGPQLEQPPSHAGAQVPVVNTQTSPSSQSSCAPQSPDPLDDEVVVAPEPATAEPTDPAPWPAPPSSSMTAIPPHPTRTNERSANLIDDG